MTGQAELWYVRCDTCAWMMRRLSEYEAGVARTEHGMAHPTHITVVGCYEEDVWD